MNLSYTTMPLFLFPKGDLLMQVWLYVRLVFLWTHVGKGWEANREKKEGGGNQTTQNRVNIDMSDDWKCIIMKQGTFGWYIYY